MPSLSELGEVSKGLPSHLKQAIRAGKIDDLPTGAKERARAWVAGQEASRIKPKTQAQRENIDQVEEYYQRKGRGYRLKNNYRRKQQGMAETAQWNQKRAYANPFNRPRNSQAPVGQTSPRNKRLGNIQYARRPELFNSTGSLAQMKDAAKRLGRPEIESAWKQKMSSVEYNRGVARHEARRAAERESQAAQEAARRSEREAANAERSEARRKGRRNTAIGVGVGAGGGLGGTALWQRNKRKKANANAR